MGVNVSGFRGSMACALVALGLVACSSDNNGGGSIPPDLAAAVELNISATQITAGQSASLSWTSSSAQSCTTSGPWLNGGPRPTTSPSGGESTGPLNVPGTYSYSLTCTGPGGSGSDNVTLFVGAVSVPTVSLNLTPSSIQPGQSAVLTWSTTNATACQTSGNWLNPGARPVVNSTGESTGPIAVTGSYFYTLSCTGPGGTSSATRTLAVSTSAPRNPPIVDIAVSPAAIAPGGSSTLFWTSSDPTASCVATGGFAGGSWGGARNPSGTEVTGAILTPGTYSFTLTCSNSGGSGVGSAMLLVSGSVPAPTVTIDVSPATLQTGQAATITWSSTNAANCVASGSWTGARGISGAQSTGALNNPGTFSYTLTCSGPGGSGSANDSVLVSGSTAPTVSFSASSTVFPERGPGTAGTTMLSWSTANATSCTAFGDWSGTRALTGSEQQGPFDVPGTYNYVLQCLNATTGQSSAAQVQLTVTPLSATKPDAALFATPQILNSGGTFSLTWTAARSSACEASANPATASWTGARAISGSELEGPLTPGFYSYVITCSNTVPVSFDGVNDALIGGGSAVDAERSGVLVSVISPPPTVDINASPSSFLAPGSSTLVWTSTNATTCTASNDWSGLRDISGSVSTGQLTEARTYFYTLTCAGPGGTASDTAAVVVGNPVVAVDLIGNNDPDDDITVNVGETFNLRWSSSNASSCSAGGGAAGDGWPRGAVGTSSAGVPVTLALAGIYSYSLNCIGAGGSDTDFVTVRVAPVVTTTDCGISIQGVPFPTVALLSPAATAGSAFNSLCILCDVNDEGNVTDGDLVSNFATINVPVGALTGNASLTVTDSGTTYPAGSRAGFVLSIPAAPLLSAQLLSGLSVQLLDANDTVVSDFAVTGGLDLDLLGLLADADKFFLANPIPAAAPFNKVRVSTAGTLEALTQTNVFLACVQPAVP